MKWYRNRLALLLCWAMVCGLCCPYRVQAQGDVSPSRVRYSGGMMLHTGYLSGTLDNGVEAQGMPRGIGGMLRVHLGPHLMVGTEGYTSTLGLRDNGSYVKYGWGGLLAAYGWQVGRWKPSLGVTLGGGGQHVLLLEGCDRSDWQPEGSALLHHSTVMVVDPYLMVEYAVTPKMHLATRLDYLLGVSEGQWWQPRGLRLYVGFLFWH